MKNGNLNCVSFVLFSSDRNIPYSAPVEERSIAISFFCVFVCLPMRLSVREHTSGTAGPIYEILYADPCGHYSVLLWRCCDTLCTSGFMDDITFGHNRPYGD